MNQVKLDTIIEAASKIFLRYGYQKTSMDDIAREAMIGKGTIYYYFNSKEDIFIAILEKIHTGIKNNIRKRINRAKTFEDKFTIFFTEPFSHFMDTHQLIRQVLNEDSPVFLKKLHDFREGVQIDFKNILHEIFDFGVACDVIKPCYANSLEKVIEIVFRWMFVGGEHVKVSLVEESIKDLAKDYLLVSDIFLNGLVIKKENG